VPDFTPGSERNWEALHTGLTGEHLTALGHLAYWAARIEVIVPQIAESLMRLIRQEGDERSVAGMRFADAFKLTTQLVEQLGSESQAARIFERHREKIRRAMRERNELLHAYWLRDHNGPPTAQRTRGAVTTSRQVPTADVERVAVTLALASDDLFIVLALIDGWMEYVEYPAETYRTARTASDPSK